MKWDLDGLANLEILNKYANVSNGYKNLSFVFYYIIGNLFYNSELYNRLQLFGNYYEFTTSEEIYNLTGIFSISFIEEPLYNTLIYSVFKEKELLSLSSNHFQLNNISYIVLKGNTNMVYLYADAISFCHYLGYKDVPKLEIIDIANNENDMVWDILLNDYIICDDKKLLFKSMKNLYPVIKSNHIDLLVNLIKDGDYKYPSLSLFNLRSVYKLDLSSYYEFFNNHFEKIYILIDKNCQFLEDEMDDLKFFIDSIICLTYDNIRFILVDDEKYISNELIELLGDLLE